MLISDNKTIGAKLRDIRKHQGLSQTTLAEMADISNRTYADIERGNASMSLRSLLNICDALNITPNDILVDDSYPIDYTLDNLMEEVRHSLPSTQVRIARFLELLLKSN